jgi:hypothetical protein
MSATCLPMEDLGNLREEVALSGIVDVLTCSLPEVPGRPQRHSCDRKHRNGLYRMQITTIRSDLGPIDEMAGRQQTDNATRR